MTICISIIYDQGEKFIGNGGTHVERSIRMTISVDQELDCSGMLCPVPVVKATKAIKQMEIGQVLKMIATDPGAPPDMAAWSRQTGHEILDETTEDDKFIFRREW